MYRNVELTMTSVPIIVKLFPNKDAVSTVETAYSNKYLGFYCRKTMHRNNDVGSHCFIYISQQLPRFP